MSLNSPSPEGQGVQPTPSAPSNDRELSELRAALAARDRELSEYTQFVERLSPHADIVKELFEDEKAAAFYHQTRDAYRDMQNRQKPQLAPEWDPERNPYVAKIDKLAGMMDKFQERFDKYDQLQQQEVNQRVVADIQEKAKKLIDQYPVLSEHNFRGIDMISQYSVKTGKSFDDAARDLEYLYRGSNAAVNAPSLRPDVGAQGVPAPTPAGPESVDMVARAAELIRHHQGLRG